LNLFCICIVFWNFETVRKFMLLPSILIFDFDFFNFDFDFFFDL
jgi:hypothetical protein